MVSPQPVRLRGDVPALPVAGLRRRFVPDIQCGREEKPDFKKKNRYLFKNDSTKSYDDMKFPLFFILVFLATGFICGCMQTVSENKTGVSADTYLTPLTTAATVTPPPASGPVQPEDPIIGTWAGYKYLASGKIQLVWTFMENNTVTLVNMDMKSRHKKYVYGTWKKEGAGAYQMTTSTGGVDPLAYDSASDRFSDAFFKETYTRITGIVDLDNPHGQVPAMNITLPGAYSVSEINGSHPYAGNKFLVVSISIRNINETGGFSFSDDRIRASCEDGQELTSINQKFEGKVENLFPSGTIGIGETRQGIVIFGVPEKSQSCTLELMNKNGDVVSNEAGLTGVPVSANNTAGPA